MSLHKDEILATLAELHARGEPLPETVTLLGRSVETRAFLQAFQSDRRPGPFVPVKQFGESLLRDRPTMKEVATALLHDMGKPNEEADVLPSFDRHNTTDHQSRHYILRSLAKFRAGGNALPRSIRIGKSELDTRSFLASFGYDAREAPADIAAYVSMTHPSVREVALSLT